MSAAPVMLPSKGLIWVVGAAADAVGLAVV
jgi:hypothetical protein